MRDCTALSARLYAVSHSQKTACVGVSWVPFAAIASWTVLECSGHPLSVPVVLQSSEGFSGREEIVCSHTDGCGGSGWSHEVWCSGEDTSAAGMREGWWLTVGLGG